MARPRRTGPRKPVPAWLLREWGDRAGEASDYCREHGIPFLVLVRYRAAAKGARGPLSVADRREVATWAISDEEPT